MEDWWQVKVGIFCRELVSGQGRWPTVKDWCQVMVQWTSEDRCQIMVGDLARRIGVRPTYVFLCGGLVSGQSTCSSAVDWIFQIEIGVVP